MNFIVGVDAPAKSDISSVKVQLVVLADSHVLEARVQIKVASWFWHGQGGGIAAGRAIVWRDGLGRWRRELGEDGRACDEQARDDGEGRGLDFGSIFHGVLVGWVVLRECGNAGM